MAEFVAPQFENPDLLGHFIRGQQSVLQQQGAQQDNQYRGMQMDQLRQTIKSQQMYQDYAGQLINRQQSPDGQSTPNSSAGMQSGPQAGVAQTSSYGGGGSPISPGTAQALALLQGKDSTEAYSHALENQQKTKQLQAEGPMSLMDSIVASPAPARMAMNNPSLMQGWQKNAAALGFDPVKDFNDDNVRKVAGFVRNQIAGQVGLPPKEYGFSGTLSPGQTAFKDGRPVASAPDQMTAYQRAELGDSRTRIGIESERLALDKTKAASVGFTPEEGAIMASLTAAGVSVPVGFRSQGQQKALYSGLIAKYPGMSPDEIADQIKSGKIDLAGEMKEATTAGGIVGKVKYAENELKGSIPLAVEASKAVPRGKFVPLTKLFQMGESEISDPALLNFKLKNQAVLNAYDMLAARGGTDVEKRKQNREGVMTATSPEAYEVAMKAFLQEADVAHKAGDEAMKPRGAARGGAHPASVQALLDKYK